MRSTRRTQPYRRGPRQPGLALSAMLRGATLHSYNPMDVQRKVLSRVSLRDWLRPR